MVSVASEYQREARTRWHVRRDVALNQLIRSSL